MNCKQTRQRARNFRNNASLPVLDISSRTTIQRRLCAQFAMFWLRSKSPGPLIDLLRSPRSYSIDVETA